MRKEYVWKLGIVAAVFLFAAYHLTPTVQWYSQPREWRDQFNAKNLDIPEIQELRAEQAKLRSATGEILDPVRYHDLEEEIAAVQEHWRNIRKKAIGLGLDLKGGQHVLLEVRKPESVLDSEFDLREAMETTIETLSNRIDQYGLQEATITTHGDRYVLIQVPGADSIDWVTDVARLQLTLMKEPGDRDDLEQTIRRISSRTGLALDKYIRRQTSTGEFEVNAEDRAVVERWLMPPPPDAPEGAGSDYERVKPHIPEGYRFVFGRKEGDPRVREWYPLYLVKTREEISGERLAHAEVTMSALNEVKVSIRFDKEGAKAFRNVTAKNVGRRMAIIMDNTVYSAPVIRERIAGGQAEISGNFTFEEAKRLAIVLTAGRLPADLHFVEQRVVGPELGADSIQKGFRAIMVSSVVVIIFMAVYYAVAGVIADIAVILNLILLLAALAMFRATLTLPGLAGFALTVGMAVDANVLIFERIREELRNRGLSPGTAVDKGYSRAFSAIWDGNLTTVIVALLLLGYGSGPLKGFAVTLTLGIVVSMFTALFCTRIVMDLLYKRPGATTVHVGKLRLFDGANFNFLAARKATLAISAVVIGLTWGYILIGGLRLGVDFEGGTLVRISLPAEVKVDDVRRVLQTYGLASASVQHLEGDKNTMQIRVRQRELTTGGHGEQDDSLALGSKLLEHWPAATIESEEAVGAKIGHDLLWKAIQLTALASLLIIGYVALRFEFWFGVCAVIALWHDVMVTVGVFNLTGGEMNLPVVAAVLTIMGYSINDTIVIFDRIRENLKAGTMRYAEIINKSVNETLSRTIITSMTVVFSAGALYFFGGPVLRDFSFALLIGLVSGTYSTLFIATPLLVMYHEWRQRKEAQAQAQVQRGRATAPARGA